MVIKPVLLSFATLFAVSRCGFNDELQSTRILEDELRDAYIVTLKPNGSPNDVAAAHRVTPKHIYEKTLVGFAAKLNQGQLTAMQHRPDVALIEPDGLIQLTSTQTNPVWGLDRIDQRQTGLSGAYNYNASGQGVNVFVIDTGVEGVRDFEGRAKLVKSFVVGESVPDGNGHGTHVSGIIGSATYGVAKKANILGVKVLNAMGSGTYSDLIAGIEYVASQHAPGLMTIANLSLGGPKTQAVDTAVNKLVSLGVFVSTAAGNNGGDACLLSPQGAASAFSVGASTVSDLRAAFSNRGACVAMFAPGMDILSWWKGGITNKISGTSMAAPHVAGVAARFCQAFGAAKCTPFEIRSWLISKATTGLIPSLDSTTPNRLLFDGGL